MFQCLLFGCGQYEAQQRSQPDRSDFETRPQTRPKTRPDQTRPDRHKIGNTFKKQAKLRRLVLKLYQNQTGNQTRPGQTRPDQTDQKYLDCDRWSPATKIQKATAMFVGFPHNINVMLMIN